MSQVELVLQNPSQTQDTLSIFLEPTKAPIAGRWLDALRKTLRTDHALEKNFCFMGWPDGPRTLTYLSEEINSHIETVNAFSQKGIWKQPYFIEERMPLTGIDQTLLNKVHHHFEILDGHVWNVSEYAKTADPKTKYAIRQLNNIVHEMELLLNSIRTRERGAREYYPHCFMSFVQKEKTRYPLTDEDYNHFEFDLGFGAAHMYYCQTGKTHFDAWKDNDSSIFDENINGLRYYSGDFTLNWGKGPDRESCANYVAPFYDWLRNKGARLENNGTYFIDQNGVKQGLGFLTIAKMPMEQFGGRSIAEVQELVTKYLDVREIKLHEDGQTLSAAYPYTFADAQHHAQQISLLY